MSESGNNILIIGVGNSGRADDGLGWAFIDEVKTRLPQNYEYEYRYQLQVEDAELISQYDQVYFVDAAITIWEEGFRMESCWLRADHGFSTHELEPETVLYLADTLYDHRPEAYILGISGFSFDLEVGLTKEGEANLKQALKFFDEKILNLIT
ncbi:MAG: hydrogenase maturation protease [Eudoraea sp.]|nr:hydrogenase maturation protease [Eudoraea sp.]